MYKDEFYFFTDMQKQPSRDLLRRKCSETMQQIYRRTPMLKYDFNKVALQLKDTSEGPHLNIVTMMCCLLHVSI